MTWYNAAFNALEEKKSFALCFDDALVLVTVHDGVENIESRIILYCNVIKNLEEQMNDIIANFQQMKNDGLEEIYKVYVGDGTYVSLSPIYEEVIFTKYESTHTGYFKNTFIFNMNHFEKFLTK